jgi:hypothetical protein
MAPTAEEKTVSYTHSGPSSSCPRRSPSASHAAPAPRSRASPGYDACTAASRWPPKTPVAPAPPASARAAPATPRARARAAGSPRCPAARQQRAAAGQHAARAQRLQHSPLAQVVAQQSKKLARARLQNLRQKPLPHQPRRLRLSAQRAHRQVRPHLNLIALRHRVTTQCP